MTKRQRDLLKKEIKVYTSERGIPTEMNQEFHNAIVESINEGWTFMSMYGDLSTHRQKVVLTKDNESRLITLVHDTHLSKDDEYHEKVNVLCVATKETTERQKRWNDYDFFSLSDFEQSQIEIKRIWYKTQCWGNIYVGSVKERDYIKKLRHDRLLNGRDRYEPMKVPTEKNINILWNIAKKHIRKSVTRKSISGYKFEHSKYGNYVEIRIDSKEDYKGSKIHRIELSKKYREEHRRNR